MHSLARILCRVGFSLWGLFALHLEPAEADRGGVTKNIVEDNVQKSTILPPAIIEPAQRAIILWNGQEEILLLSTDLGHNPAADVIEAIPLPTEPRVRLGSLSTFRSLAELALVHEADFGALATFRPEGRLSGVRTAFAERTEDFSTATSQSLRRPRADAVPQEFLKIIGNYQLRGYPWFVFDEVELHETIQTFPPIEYRFRTDRLYYPLEISTRDFGNTRVDLVWITPRPLTQVAALDSPLKRQASFTMPTQELVSVNQEWPAFMRSPNVTVQHVRLTGDIRRMAQDVLAR